MLDSLKKMTITQQNQFRDAANKLLNFTFLCRDKRDNKESYYFLMSYKEIFDEFFKILGYEVELDQASGSVMLTGYQSANSLRLKRDETIILLILRVLYYEKMKDTSLNENITCLVSDIHEKYDYLQIKQKLNKTDIVNTLRLLRRYNLIEIVGDVTTKDCAIVILPTILLAIKSEDITEVYNTITRITAKEAD